MPQITQITPQRKRDFFNILIDGKFAFGLDAETLVKEKLSVGRSLSDADVANLNKVSIYSKLLNSALNFLSVRPRSKKEMSQNLKEKIYKLLGKENLDLSTELESRVLSKIESLGYLDDKEFARWWVQQRRESQKLCGPILIRRELFAKGVDKAIIESALEDYGASASSVGLEEILAKKGRSLRDKTLFERRRKLYDFLLRRGFSYDIVRVSVDKYLKRA
jgi:regulatory protein